MDRRQTILQGISKQMLGVEIGPYHSPLVPKKEGYRSLSLDIHDQAKLRINAAEASTIDEDGIARIEEVDLVGSATDLADLIAEKGLLGQIDYIVSSHNFEHLPNPIKFLNDCALVLKPEGIISMAIPDRRGCFDFFRPWATTADFIDAFLNNIAKPSVRQLLTHQLLQSRRFREGKEISSWDWRDESSDVFSIAKLDEVKQWIEELRPENKRDYGDTHASTFTRSSFELIIRDLHYMRFIDVGVDLMEGPHGNEFFARLSKNVPMPTKDDFYRQRAGLLHEIIDDMATNSRSTGALSRELCELKEELSQLQHDFQKLQQKGHDQEHRLRSILASGSWRLTAPFRIFGRRL